METVNTSPTMTGRIVETLGEIVEASIEVTAQISLGQGLLKIVDRLLWVVEKSAQWSLPIHEVNAEENGKTFGKIELVRPLPWIFFLPSLVFLRACRLGINMGAAILGYPKLQVSGMVKFIQKGRRRLRTIKYNGLKNMRYRKSSRIKEDELTEAKKSLIKSMLSTLSALSCIETSRRTPSPPPTRVYVQCSNPDTQISTPDEQSTTESTSPKVDPKRKYSQVSHFDDDSDLQSEEESTDVKLSRLGNAPDSDPDDQDFNPAEEELVTSDSTTADEDDDHYLSDTELNDLIEDQIMSRTLQSVIATDAVIPEESEPESPSESDSKVRTELEVMNKSSTPNKLTDKTTLVTLLLPKKTEDDTLEQDGQSTTPGADSENNTNFYSPINSPGDSICEITSPVTNDEKNPFFVEEQSSNTTLNITQKDSETQLDKKGLESTESSMISGNSTDGQDTTTNGTTNDEERSNPTAEKSQHDGKQSDLPQSKKK